jgi:hypothetical protein
VEPEKPPLFFLQLFLNKSTRHIILEQINGSRSIAGRSFLRNFEERSPLIFYSAPPAARLFTPCRSWLLRPGGTALLYLDKSRIFVAFFFGHECSLERVLISFRMLRPAATYVFQHWVPTLSVAFGAFIAPTQRQSDAAFNCALQDILTCFYRRCCRCCFARAVPLP